MGKEFSYEDLREVGTPYDENVNKSIFMHLSIACAQYEMCA